jgi:hypothetical protein
VNKPKTKKERRERLASFAGLMLGMTTWEIWKGFWRIQIPALEFGIGVPLLTLGAVLVAFTILGDIQDAFLGRKYLFDFSKPIPTFLNSYTAIIAGFSFLLALMTGVYSI